MNIIKEGVSIVFPCGLRFHESFIKTYKGKAFIPTIKFLRRYYTKSQVKQIVRYLKSEGIIHENIS